MRLIGRPRHRWEYNISMDLNNDRFEGCGSDSYNSVQIPVAGSCEHGNETAGSIKGGEILD
jgi:hypothetical protein